MPGTPGGVDSWVWPHRASGHSPVQAHPPWVPGPTRGTLEQVVISSSSLPVPPVLEAVVCSGLNSLADLKGAANFAACSAFLLVGSGDF